MIQRFSRPTVWRFLLVGSSSTLLNLVLLWVLTSVLGLRYLGSSIASYCLSTAYNFLFQRSWAFAGIAGAVSSQLPYFVVVNLLGLLLNTTILYLLVEKFGVWYLVAQAVTSLIVAAQSFFAYRWIFQTRALPRACS